MRIRLRKMSAAAFADFADRSARAYAEDLAQARGLPMAQALAQARRELCAALPQGPETANQRLLSIEDADSGRDVGWLWFLFEATDGVRQVFLNDLWIAEAARRRGCAAAALSEMERLAEAEGCEESVLYVWRLNEPGVRLYQKCGYRPFREAEGGMYMKKRLRA